MKRCGWNRLSWLNTSWEAREHPKGDPTEERLGGYNTRLAQNVGLAWRMTELALVRHGTTEWNTLGILQGQTDVPLSRAGRAEIIGLAEEVKGMGFEAIYCSDLLRARQSAMAFSVLLDLPVCLDPRLREISLGIWEGLTGWQVQELYPREWTESGLDGAPGGERLSQVALRMSMAADEMAWTHPAGRVLIVGHGTALKTLICQAEGRPLSGLNFDSFPNASLRLIRWG